MGSDAEKYGNDAVANELKVPFSLLLRLLCRHLRVRLVKLLPVAHVVRVANRQEEGG